MSAARTKNGEDGGGGERGGPSEEFQSGLGGVKPLDPAPQRAVRAHTRARSPSTGPQPAIRFEHPDPNEPRLGRVSGVSDRVLAELRNGRTQRERSVDLHRLDETGARRTLVASLAAASAAGERCVLVIHGRGLHSGGAAILKEALPGWLEERGLRERILAYAPAAAEGGDGAMAILLRKPRSA